MRYSGNRELMRCSAVSHFLEQSHGPPGCDAGVCCGGRCRQPQRRGARAESAAADGQPQAGAAGGASRRQPDRAHHAQVRADRAGAHLSRILPAPAGRDRDCRAHGGRRICDAEGPAARHRADRVRAAVCAAGGAGVPQGLPRGRSAAVAGRPHRRHDRGRDRRRAAHRAPGRFLADRRAGRRGETGDLRGAGLPEGQAARRARRAS